MDVLNSNFDFSRAPAEIQEAFARTTSVFPTELKAGTRLFKATGYDLYGPDAKGRRALHDDLTSWWSTKDPLVVNGLAFPGLEETLLRARANGGNVEAWWRKHFAVAHDWNALVVKQLGLVRILIVRLRKPVIGFAGVIRQQDRARVTERWISTGRSKVLAGGEPQLWIPNLTSEHLEPGMPIQLVG